MTIRELAKIAGVSRTTVSRALNNAASVSKETRDRVLKLAKTHGYQSNPMIAALMSDVRRRRVQPNKAILAIAPPAFQTSRWGEGHYANKLYRIGVESRARELGFRVEDFMPSDYNGSHERISRVLYNRGIQALLVPSIDIKNPPEAYDYAMDWSLFSVAGIGFSISEPRNLDRAVVGHFASASTALKRIEALGYRRIGFCVRSIIHRRTQGRWLAAYLLHNSERKESPVLPHFEFEFGPEAKDRFLRWFESNRPEAILGERYFLQLMLDCGLSVPGDVKFALLDLLPGDPDSEGYAGIDQRFESVGAATVNLIVGRVNRNERGLPEEPHILKVSGRWIDGASLPPAVHG